MGSNPCRNFTLLSVAHPIWETFQVQDRHRRTTLIQGHNCEKGRHVALLPFCKIFWNNLVLMCNICKSVMIKLLCIVLNIILYVLNEHG